MADTDSALLTQGQLKTLMRRIKDAGGGGGDHSDWGTVEYYTDIIDSFSLDGMNATASMQDAQVYKQFLSDNEIDQPSFVDFMYEDVDGTNCWITFSSAGEVVIPDDEMLATTGISVTIDDPSDPWGGLMVQWTRTVDTAGSTATLQLTSKEDYDALAGNVNTTDPDYGPFGTQKVKLYCKQVKGFTFPNWWVGYAPDRFLESASNLVAVDSLYTLKLYVDDEPRPVIPVEKIGSYFMSGCTSFNGQLLFGPEGYDPTDDSPSVLTKLEIGSYFLYGCTSLNTLVGVLAKSRDTGHSDLVSVGYGFMDGCSSYVQKSLNPGLYVDLYSYILQNAATIPGNFMANTAVTNIQSTSWGIYASEIGDGFFNGIPATSITVVLNRAKTIGAILGGCNSATKIEVRMSNVESLTSIGSGCSNLTEIDVTPLPVRLTTVGSFCGGSRNLTSIKCGDRDGIVLPNVLVAGNILSGCSSYNQQIMLPRAATVGGGFLNGATSFNQDLKFDCIYSLTGLAHDGFMYNCNAFTSTIDFGGTLPSALASQWSGNILSTTSASSDMYTTGVKIKGEHAADFLTTFPDSSSSPYRKLVLAS